jgi:hypothetical protein
MTNLTRHDHLIWLIWLSHRHLDGPFKIVDPFDQMYNLTLGQNGPSSVSFMPHAFNQNKHPFGQCGHLSQVEPFEKPWFVVMHHLS